MKAEQTKEIFHLVLGGWPTQRQKMTDEDVGAMATLYALSLADVDFARCKAAVVRLVQTSRMMPSVADIRAELGIVQHGVVRAGAEAWGEVLRAMRTRGSHRSPGVDFEFADPITARVVTALGWLDLCASDNQAADRARFIEAYDQISRTERREAQTLPGATSPRLPSASDAAIAQLVGSVARNVDAGRRLAPKPDSMVLCACGHNKALHFRDDGLENCWACTRCECLRFEEQP